MSHDLELVRLVVASPELRDMEREVFEKWQDALERGSIHQLSEKQRQWIRDVAARLNLLDEQALNLWSSGKVMAGRQVETPAVLRELPKAPPRRRV